MNKVLLTMASAAIIVIGVGVISSQASAFLDQNCNGRGSCSDDDNSTNNSGGEGGTGISGGSFGGEGGEGGEGGSVGDVTSKSKLTNTNDLSNRNKQGQGQGQGQSVYIEGDEAASIPVSSAHAAALTSADDTCMGSSSAGFQGMSFGISFGSTWRDEDCVRRKDSRMFYNMQMKDVAVARMCQKADNRDAVEAAGGVCPGTEASVTPEVETAAVEEVKAVEESTFDRLRRNNR